MAKLRRVFPKAVVVYVNRHELNRWIIENFINKGATKVALITDTEPKLNKTHRTAVDADGKKVRNPFEGHCKKLSFFVAGIGLDYGKQKAKYSDVPVQEHLWGDHFMGSRNVIVKRTDPSQFYLALYPEYEADWAEKHFYDTHDQEEIAEHELEDYFPPRSENPTGYNNYSLNSIVGAKFGGEIRVLESYRDMVVVE